jgi:hypothetical protein
MNVYRLDGREIDSVDLKCLLVGHGVKVAPAVYRAFSRKARLSPNPLECNCLILSDGTVCQLTDMSFHLKYLSGVLSWDNLRLLRYASKQATPFRIICENEKAALYRGGDFLDFVRFPLRTDFYKRRTPEGLPYHGNAVLQGLDWVAFQCLWYCEYAAEGEACAFCFSGAEHESLAGKGRAQPLPLPPESLRDIVANAIKNDEVSALQITGGSTFDGVREAEYVRSYLEAIGGVSVYSDVGASVDAGQAAAESGSKSLMDKLRERILYITPPRDKGLRGEYFRLGTGRIACSLEVWDEGIAREVTPGKMKYTTRERHISALTYIAEKYGPSGAMTNFIAGLEPYESLLAGAEEMARRGILPSIAVWMPMGRPVLGKAAPPDVDFYRRVKENVAEIYEKYKLTPPETRGLNVCIESDIIRWIKR